MCVEMWKYVYGARYLLRCARVWMQALLPFKFQLSVQTNEQPKNIHTKIPIFLSLSVCLIPDANDFPVAITNHIHDDKHDICWFKFLGQPRRRKKKIWKMMSLVWFQYVMSHSTHNDSSNALYSELFSLFYSIFVVVVQYFTIFQTYISTLLCKLTSFLWLWSWTQ